MSQRYVQNKMGAWETNSNMPTGPTEDHQEKNNEAGI